MSRPSQSPPIAPGQSGRWPELAERVLAGHVLSEEEGLAILRSGDHEVLDVLAAAYRVRYRWFENRVHLNFLINAKSGACGEDCGYCSQSKLSKADVPTYSLLDPQQILDGARLAAQRQARTYCIVLSGLRPTEPDLETVLETVPRIKETHPLEICLSAGLLTPRQAQSLKASGVDRVNHNLNTSQRFYPEICSTHTYAQRLETLRTVRRAGLQICSGAIVGLGERHADLVELALRLGELEVEALPVNFLVPIPGTPVQDAARLTPVYCLKVLSMFRLANPRAELRIAAGREMHLGDLQPLGLYAASSIFVGDYLTTKGQAPQKDYRMIQALGFEAVPCPADQRPDRFQ